jgi:hypothetical protein
MSLESVFSEGAFTKEQRKSFTEETKSLKRRQSKTRLSFTLKNHLESIESLKHQCRAALEANEFDNLVVLSQKLQELGQCGVAMDGTEVEKVKAREKVQRRPSWFSRNLKALAEDKAMDLLNETD